MLPCRCIYVTIAKNTLYMQKLKRRQEEGEHAELSSMSMLEKGSHVCSLSSVAFLIVLFTYLL